MPSGRENRDSDYDEDVDIEDDEYEGTNLKQRQRKGKTRASAVKGVSSGQDVGNTSLLLDYSMFDDRYRDTLGKRHTRELGMLFRRMKVVAFKVLSKNFSLEGGEEGTLLGLRHFML
jgi:hypothetical protein